MLSTVNSLQGMGACLDGSTLKRVQMRFIKVVRRTEVRGAALTEYPYPCRYDLALISGALSEIRDQFGLSEVMEEVIVGAAKIGAFFGTFLGEICECECLCGIIKAPRWPPLVLLVGMQDAMLIL